jgi:hypothetical protein
MVPSFVTRGRVRVGAITINRSSVAFFHFLLPTAYGLQPHGLLRQQR